MTVSTQERKKAGRWIWILPAAVLLALLTPVAVGPVFGWMFQTERFALGAAAGDDERYHQGVNVHRGTGFTSVVLRIGDWETRPEASSRRDIGVDLTRRDRDLEARTVPPVRRETT